MGVLKEGLASAAQAVLDAITLKNARNWYATFGDQLQKGDETPQNPETRREALVTSSVKEKIMREGLQWPQDASLQQWIVMHVLIASAKGGGDNKISPNLAEDPVAIAHALIKDGVTRLGTMQDSLIVPEKVRKKLGTRQ